jgi:uroporphyrinogen decarboxylase
MDPRRIKQQFGKHLAFWGGGVETQTTLPFGSVEDVRREVRERVKLLGADGGYVFATIHNLQADISPEKIMAIYDTVAECGKYPL